MEYSDSLCVTDYFTVPYQNVLKVPFPGWKGHESTIPIKL